MQLWGRGDFYLCTTSVSPPKACFNSLLHRCCLWFFCPSLVPRWTEAHNSSIYQKQWWFNWISSYASHWALYFSHVLWAATGDQASSVLDHILSYSNAPAILAHVKVTKTCLSKDDHTRTKRGPKDENRIDESSLRRKNQWGAICCVVWQSNL